MHSINHEPPAMDQRWPQNSAGNGYSFVAVAAVLRTMAADSAIVVLIDIFRLLVRSGVIAAFHPNTGRQRPFHQS
jgi:hypothetical protein